MLLLIGHGEVYAPEARGEQAVLVTNDRIEAVGAVDRRAVEALGTEHEVIDAAGCIILPGLVDPHEHLLGGSGEGSLAPQTPMLFIDEIVRAASCDADLLILDWTSLEIRHVIAAGHVVVRDGAHAPSPTT